MAFDREPPGRRDDLEPVSPDPAADLDAVAPARWPGKRTLTQSLSARIYRRATGGEISPLARRFLERAAARSGHPLPDALRQRLERALRTDLSHVRIHTGGEAGEAAGAIAARAYTVGSDIYFADGAYQPGSAEFERLVAHEVAHTVQQTSAGPGGELSISSPGETAEVDADRFADSFAIGLPPPLGAAELAAEPTPASIHRTPEPDAQVQRVLPMIPTTVREIKNFKPSGDTAPFDVTYDPLAGLMKIVCRVHFEFKDGEPDKNPRNQQRWTAAEKQGWSERAVIQLDNISRQSISLKPKEPERPEGPLPPTVSVLSSLRVRVQVEIQLVSDPTKAHATIVADRPRAREFGELLGPYQIGSEDAVEVLVSMTGIPEWDQVFGSNTTEPDTATKLVELRARIAQLDRELALRPGLSGAGALHAERIDLAADVKWLATKESKQTDCITYAMEVLAASFASVGRSADWERVKGVAFERSRVRAPTAGISGIDLITALQGIGWVVFHMVADADPGTSENKGTPHHLYEDRMSKARVPSYGAPKRGVPGVFAEHHINDYAPAQFSLSPTNKAGLEQLRSLPLAFICTRGAYHTALLTKGKVFDGHASTGTETVTVRNVENWTWQSAFGIAPAEDIAKAFGPPRPGVAPNTGSGQQAPAPNRGRVPRAALDPDSDSPFGSDAFAGAMDV